MAEHKFVIFRLGDERYGIPIESVERILPDQSVTRLPRTPKMMLGVFELRGTTIPAIDGRLRFDMDASNDAQNFVVVLADGGRCALRVDSVEGIQAFEDDEVDPDPGFMDSKTEAFMKGIGKKGDQLTALLDPERVVPAALRKAVAGVA